MVNVKFGHQTYNISDQDEIMYNGSCFQLITKNAHGRLSGADPILAKVKAQAWIKSGVLVEHRRSKSKMIEHELIYYRFQIEKLEGV